VRIERSLEQTKAGLKFKQPKSKRGRRVVALPSIAVDALQTHRRRQLELRLAFGLIADELLIDPAELLGVE
jgi:hypothetical protein